MAEWRARKYVLDSDDEEERLSIEETKNDDGLEELDLENDGFLDIDELGGRLHGDWREVTPVQSAGNENEPVSLCAGIAMSGSACSTSKEEARNVFENGQVFHAVAKVSPLLNDDNIDELQLDLSKRRPMSDGPELGPRSHPVTHKVLDVDAGADELQQAAKATLPQLSTAFQLTSELSLQACNNSATDETIKTGSRGPILVSPTSSPLSEAFSTPRDGSTSCEIYGATSNTRNLQSTVESVGLAEGSARSSNDGRDSRLHETIAVSNETAGRALRKRNPIQLHPYALEGEIYRQTLKARGIKPLRINQAEQEDTILGEMVSQEHVDGTNGEQHIISSDAGCYSGTLSSPQRASSAIQFDQVSQADSEDFPDVRQLIGVPQDTIRYKSKRRKIAHTYSNQTKAAYTDHTQLAVVVHSNSRTEFEPSDIFNPPFNVQYSPPPSSGPMLCDHDFTREHLFRFPPGTTPAQQRTPATSSELKPSLVLEVDEESDIGDLNSQALSDQQTKENTTVDVSSSEDESELQMRRVQRKIRGILPASWLRLDLKTQDTRATLQEPITDHGLSPADEIIGRRVAMPVSSHRNRETNLDQAIPVENMDSSNSESISTLNIHKASISGDAIDSFLDDNSQVFADDGMEAVEGDHVDPMLPPRSRLHAPIKFRKKRQSKLIETDRTTKRIENRTVFKHPAGIKTRQPKISEHAVRTAKMEESPQSAFAPQMSILDAPNLSNIRAVPSFVRIAMRKARSRVDKGKHSPSRKCLHLATREDTNDIQDTLKTWQRGKYPVEGRPQSRIRQYKASGRIPLGIRSGNERARGSAYYFPKEDEEKVYPAIANSPTTNDREEQNRYELPNFLPQISKGQPLVLSRFQMTPNRIASQNNPHKRKFKKRQLVFTLGESLRPRPAVLELNRRLIDSNDGSASHCVENSTSAVSGVPEHVSRLYRYLGYAEIGVPEIPLPKGIDGLRNNVGNNVENRSFRPAMRGKCKRRRKRQPHQLHIDAPRFRQDSVPLHDENEVAAIECRRETSQGNSRLLHGLRSYGTEYPTTFGLRPLSPAVHFHPKTFLGSGDFAAALDFTAVRDLDTPYSTMEWEVGNTQFSWGPWNETVSSQISLAFEQIGLGLQEPRIRYPLHPEVENTVIYLRHIMYYITRSIYFLDPVDRVAFLERLMGLFSSLLDDLTPCSPSPEHQMLANTGACPTLCIPLIQISMQTLTIIFQLQQIARHELVPQSLRSELKTVFARSTRQLATIALSTGFDRIRIFLQDDHLLHATVHGIDAQLEIESILVLFHVLDRDSESVLAFWNVINLNILGSRVDAVTDVQSLDRQWYQMLSLLPFLELDTRGTIRDRQRFLKSSDNWRLVKRLVEPVLVSYAQGSSRQGPTFNSYFRAVLGRCFSLISLWGWQRCESIVGILFDFFASINLGNLRYEVSHGSPTFLEQLKDNLLLDITKEDRCFHVFLKILGTGLRQMRTVYPDKKIRDIAWRMMPNHNRRHPKDEAITQEDLDALRNHHDLLCVLYWATPCGFRSRLSVIQNLVQMEDSHKEACHISIRAWSYLVNFQISTNESLSNLEPFTAWYTDILRQIMRQHSLARLEVEAQAETAMSAEGRIISRDIQEFTIAKNQRQIEALLSDALLALRKAVDVTQSPGAADQLFPDCLGLVLDLFDAKQPRANGVIILALDVILAYTKHTELCANNEDSQNYGDWSDFASELGDFAQPRLDIAHRGPIYDSVRRLLSNCFGAETTPEDTILLKLVHTWITIARVYVEAGVKQWIDYIGSYGEDTWDGLSDTVHKRKFSGTFLASFIEQDGSVYRENKQYFLKAWMASLVERESLLKFQHQFTSAVLNVDRDDALVYNVPFCADTKTGRFCISSNDFRDRRLSLLSSVLSNMREALDFSTYHNLPGRAALKREYTELLKHMMATMKHNYQELGSGLDVRGIYVEFVQRAVELLQQYCAEICPVDRFFTDPAAFPLPAKDPTYVVGRLKNYGLRLRDEKTAKQLSVFVQAISERAAADGQQQYLSDQLAAAMTENSEKRSQMKLTLRAFLVQAIFPAYIDLAVSTYCGPLLVMPILRALEVVLHELVYDLDGFDHNCVTAVEATIFTLLQSMIVSTQAFLGCPSNVQEPLPLRVLSMYFSVATTALPLLDYLTRIQPRTNTARAYVNGFRNLAHHVRAVKLSEPRPFLPICDASWQYLTDHRVAAARTSTLKELKNTLHTNWSNHGGLIYLTRGKTRMLVHHHVGSSEQEWTNLLAHIQDFYRILDNLPAFSDESDIACKRRPPEGIEDVIF
ncbi:hypothetical protein MMC19_005183 [Ptychographa xylographoides]|nr:hypothetical protein [Ptychographa xylographoides]